jgi:hypothetical protein
VYDLTGFPIAALEDPWGSVALAYAVALEEVCARCDARPALVGTGRESAERLLDALVAVEALVLAEGSATAREAVVAVLERALTRPWVDAAERAQALFTALLASPAVLEVFLDEDRLVEILARW